MKNWYEGRSIAFDLDGTIIHDGFPELGQPNWEVVDLMRKLRDLKWYIVIATSRPHAYFDDIRKHLVAHNIPFDQIVTAGKPNVDIYVDDRGLLPPIHALEAFIHEKANPGYLWSDVGLQGWMPKWAVEQVRVPENPDAVPLYDDPRFRVMIAFSGGMDSATMAMMACLESLPHELVYVDVGQDYAGSEFSYAAVLGVDISGQHVHKIVGPQIETSWKHIIPGRNAAIISGIANYARSNGWWGEVWFGNLGGESPAIGGDKSSRFLLTMQHLLTLQGLDFRVASPLRGLDKPDLVRLWQQWGKLEALWKIKSCYHPTEQRCGKCQVCARTLLAYEAAGVPWDRLFDATRVGVDMHEHFTKYFKSMFDHKEGEDTRYSGRRRLETMDALYGLIYRSVWNGVDG